MQLAEDYQVRLDSFCGPLDLLLYLIRQAEVDINDIPIAEVTDQYLGFLRQVEDIDIEAAGEFLVMAATLMEIKSRTIMPPLPPAGEGGEAREEGAGADAMEQALASAADRGDAVDPRYELVRQLLDYQRHRMAAETLDERRVEFGRRFPARMFVPEMPASEPGESAPLELEDAHVFDLVDAYRRISLAVDFARLGDHHVRMDDTPAAVYQAELIERLRAEASGRLTLQEAFEDRDRVHRLGLFLAMLELVRLRRITIQQEELEAEILVTLNDDPGDGPSGGVEGELQGSRDSGSSGDSEGSGASGGSGGETEPPDAKPQAPPA